MEDVFSKGVEPGVWRKNNEPAGDLIYRKGYFLQLDSIAALGVLLGVSPRIVGYHTSKSVRLPVSCFQFKPYDQVVAHAFVRDNFYDIKCCVVSGVPVDVRMSFAHEEVDEEWLEKEIARFTDYTGKALPKGDDWYRDNWSSGEIVRDGGRIYRASGVQSVYCEGIDDLGLPGEVFRVYRPGMSMFSISLQTDVDLACALQCVKHSVRRSEIQRRMKRED